MGTKTHTLAGPNAQWQLTSIEFAQIEAKSCELKIKSPANQIRAGLKFRWRSAPGQEQGAGTFPVCEASIVTRTAAACAAVNSNPIE